MRVVAVIIALIVVGSIGVYILIKEEPQEKKVYQIGILGGGSFTDIGVGFKDEMTELGYIEGENIVYDWPEMSADLAEVQQVSEKFVEDKVDLIFTSGSTPAALAAKEATLDVDIPVVFAYAATEESGLVDSVREPGGHITGVRYPGHEMMVKRLELLLEIAPDVQKVWIGYDINNPNTNSTLATLRPAASSLEITLVEVPAVTLDELEADLQDRNESEDPGIDAIILMPDGFSHGPDGLATLIKFARELKVPLGGSFLYTVQAGAVYGNANDLLKVGELAAPIVDKVLKGIPAGTIPVVTPEQDIWINYIVAQELGLTVPEGLLAQADEIIQ